MVITLLLAAAAAQCALPSGEMSRQVALSYERFDGETGQFSWRQLNARGCTESAVQLLQKYSASRSTTLDLDERSELAFHVGQVLAFAGRDFAALPHFAEALRIGGTEEWTTYVRATVAFLRRDRNQLSRANDRYERLAGDPMRIKVINGFMACPDRSYLEAVHCAM